MQWIFNDTTVQFDVIGYFYQNLTIDKDDIKWHTKNGKVRMGQMLVIWKLVLLTASSFETLSHDLKNPLI